jgi:hypothetical protein
LLDGLEILYIPWFLSGIGGIGLNHSTYARYVGTSAAHKDWSWVDGNICRIAVAGI